MRSFSLPPLLMDPAPAAGGGGFSDEQVQMLKALIADGVNNGVNAGYRKLEAKITALDTKMTTALDPETLSDLLEKPMGERLFATPEEVEQYRAEHPEAFPAAAPPAAAARPTPTGADAQLNAKLLTLENNYKTAQTRIQELETKNTETEKRAVTAQMQKDVQAVINDFPLASSDARELVFDYFYGKAKRLEDGSIVVPTNAGELPLKDAVDARVRALPGLLAPVRTGGAGATAAVGGRETGPTLESIKPGQSKEERAAAAAAIAANLSGMVQA